MNHPHTVMGLGDGGAHYGAICDASYPTFFLTYWVRDRQGTRMPFAKAVQALAHDPARTVGLTQAFSDWLRRFTGAVHAIP